MIKATLNVDTLRIADKLSDKILEMISDSEELEALTDKGVTELSNIVNHALAIELESELSSVELVAR